MKGRGWRKGELWRGGAGGSVSYRGEGLEDHYGF